jgi:hypothetical protein
MGRKAVEEEVFIPQTCLKCENTCKKEIGITLKKGFESGRSELFCPRFKKKKKSK